MIADGVTHVKRDCVVGKNVDCSHNGVLYEYQNGHVECTHSQWLIQCHGNILFLILECNKEYLIITCHE